MTTVVSVQYQDGRPATARCGECGWVGSGVEYMKTYRASGQDDHACDRRPIRVTGSMVQALPEDLRTKAFAWAHENGMPDENIVVSVETAGEFLHIEEFDRDFLERDGILGPFSKTRIATAKSAIPKHLYDLFIEAGAAIR